LVLGYDLLFFTAFSIIAMLAISPKLTLLALAAWPIALPFILHLARQERLSYIKTQGRLAALSNFIAQNLATIRLQRATASSGFWLHHLEEEATSYARQRRHFLRLVWAIFPLGALPSLISYAVMFTFGIREITAGELTV